MWLRLLRAAIRRARGGFIMMLVATALGCALVSALLAVSLGVQDKISRELNRYGANIQVLPVAGAGSLAETDVAGLKSSIFWRHNVVGITPYLYETGSLSASSGATADSVVAGTWFDKEVAAQEQFRTGLKTTAPYLSLTGRWPADADVPQAVLGVDLARRLGVAVGDVVTVRVGSSSETVTVSGIAEGGGFEDGQAIMPLATVQRLSARPGQLSQVLVSAVTVPLDSFGRRDPKSMTRREYDKWYCTAYVTSVAQQIQESWSSGAGRCRPQVQRRTELGDADGAQLVRDLGGRRGHLEGRHGSQELAGLDRLRAEAHGWSLGGRGRAGRVDGGHQRSLARSRIWTQSYGDVHTTLTKAPEISL